MRSGREVVDHPRLLEIQLIAERLCTDLPRQIRETRAAVDDGPRNVEARVRDGCIELRPEFAHDGREALIIGAAKPPPREKCAWTGGRRNNGHSRLGPSDVANHEHACVHRRFFMGCSFHLQFLISGMSSPYFPM